MGSMSGTEAQGWDDVADAHREREEARDERAVRASRVPTTTGLRIGDHVARVLICGSRTYPEDDQMVDLILSGIEDQHTAINMQPTVIEGGARGADAAALNWVRGFGSEHPHAHEQFSADWETHGKRAGFIRNVQMLDSQPDVVVAFVDKPLAESKGTAHTVREAIKRGIPTYVVRRMGADS